MAVSLMAVVAAIGAVTVRIGGQAWTEYRWVGGGLDFMTDNPELIG